jgi:hypothetical protein
MTLYKLRDGQGFTLKQGKKIHYKTGYQVATTGVECKSVNEAMNAIKSFNGNCGVWYYQGIFYIDNTKHIMGLHKAIELGRTFFQKTIYEWRSGKCIWCGAVA